LRTLFFGTSTFAVPSLRVVAAQTQLAGVVTQPDRPAGRGHRLKPSAVKSAALDLGAHVCEPVSLREFAASLRPNDHDLFILASYGRILPQALLDLPRLGSLNVHPSLLPKYRGATPIQTALANGERETGVTIMRMDAGLDTGEIVLQERVSIAPDEHYGELHDRLALIGADLLASAIALAESGRLRSTPQRGEASVTRPLTKDDLTLDLRWAPQRLVDKVRALAPQPAARATLDGEVVKVLRAHVAPDGALVIDELIAPNRGRMSGDEYHRMRSAAAKNDRA
jgi:methionyl-tRNA formyltransferase